VHIVFIILLFLSSQLYSIEIDIDLLKKEVSSNPKDITSRLLLIRSYISDHDYNNAQKLVDEVLKIDKSNQKALFFNQDIKKLKQIKSLVGGDLSGTQKLENYFAKLLNDGKYKNAIANYEVLKRNNIKTDSKIDLYIVDSYVYMKQYNKAFNLIEKTDLSQEEKFLSSARIYVAQGKYKEAEDEYKKVLENVDSKLVAIALFDLLNEEGKFDEATEFVKKYNSLNPQSEISIALKNRDHIMYKKRVDELGKVYQEKHTFKTLKEYYYGLEKLGKKDKAQKVLRSFVKKHPKHEEAVLFLAKKLYWNHKSKQSLSLLKPVVGKTKNREILTLYTDILLQQKRKNQALPYLKKLVKLDHSEKTRRKIEKIKIDSFLEKAVNSYKMKNYIRALKYYNKYYDKTKDPKIAKEIAELYFVTKQIKKSLPFYGAYLRSNPKDSKIRFRYASALTSLKRYKKAEREYKRVALENKSLSDLSTYRYATSLIAQKNEPKWNYSRKVLRNLLARLNKKAPSKDRDDLIKFTRATLKKVSKPMPKPTKYKDVILAEGQKKIIQTQPPFDSSKLVKRDISSVKSMLLPSDTSINKSDKKDISLSLHSLDDDIISNISYGIRLNKVTKVADGTLSLEAKKSRFKTAQTKRTVDGFLAHFSFEHFSFGIGLNKFEDFNDVVAQITYQKIFSGHNMTFGLKTTNGAFVNSNVCMIEDKINVVQFSLYDAILLSNLDQAELGLTVNRYDDTNINVNSWAEYPVYRSVYENFENVFALSGSYEFNTKTDTCYYSADFFDGNYIVMKPKIYFTKRNFIQGIAGFGYSFKNKDVLYNYGLSAVISAYDLFDIRVDCRHYQSGTSPEGANECFATMAYIW
jgi:tetratricopeptide (TPR) repeat protein